MINIDFSNYHQFIKIFEKDGKRYLFDPIRKSNYVVQPEELVRQCWIEYLVREHKVSPASLSIEKQLIINALKKRIDLVIYKKAEPFVLFEFKSFNQKINNNTTQQAAIYNLKLKVPYLVVSNGVVSHAFQIDFEAQDFHELNNLDFLTF